MGRQILIASDCWMLAKALVRQGKPADALPHARRAVDIYTRLGLPDLTRLGLPDLEDARAILAECEA